MQENNVMQENNTLDLVKDNTNKNAFSIFCCCCIIFEMQEKGQTMMLDSRCNLDVVHKMAAVCVQSFRLIQRRITSLHNIMYQICHEYVLMCPELVNLYIFKYITIENTHKCYGRKTMCLHTPRNVIHDGSLASLQKRH